MKASPKNWLSPNKKFYLSFINQKALIRLLVFLFMTRLSFAQTFSNLIPNGSFETYTTCPNNSSQVYYAPPWIGPTVNSSDLFHACANPNSMGVPYYCGVGSSYPCYQPAVNNGNGYAGMWTYQLNYREYLEVPLTKTLEAGKCYYGEFYTTSATTIKYYVNNIAGSFGNVQHPTNLGSGILLNLPQHIINYGNPVFKDTLNWQKVSGIYQANGTESVFTIGNFKDDSNTDTVNIYPPGSNFYYAASNAYNNIDAVSVYSIDPIGILPWSYRDTTVNVGDSVFIGNQMGGVFTSNWYMYSGSFINSGPGIYVKPVSTSTYVVQFTVCGVPRNDTLVVTVTGLGVNEIGYLNNHLKIYPQPAQDILNIELPKKNNKNFNRVSIYNSLGELMKEDELIFKENKADFRLQYLANGVYFITISNQNHENITKKLVIAH